MSSTPLKLFGDAALFVLGNKHELPDNAAIDLEITFEPYISRANLIYCVKSVGGELATLPTPYRGFCVYGLDVKAEVVTALERIGCKTVTLKELLSLTSNDPELHDEFVLAVRLAHQQARYIESRLVDIFEHGLHGLIIEVGTGASANITRAIVRCGGSTTISEEPADLRVTNTVVSSPTAVPPCVLASDFDAILKALEALAIKSPDQSLGDTKNVKLASGARKSKKSSAQNGAKTMTREEMDYCSLEEPGEREEDERVEKQVKKAFVRHAISASEMALFVVPEQLRFTGLPATQLAPICITRLADAGHGALPSDFIKVLMAECSLHRSEEWKEMQTAIKSGNNEAVLSLSLRCLDKVVNEILPRVEDAWAEHGTAAEQKYNWPSAPDRRLAVHFKENGPTFVRLWAALRFMVSAPETRSLRDQHQADHIMEHDGISFALVAVRAMPRKVYETWARLAELVDPAKAKPLIDKLLVHRRIPFGASSAYNNHPLIYAILSDYVGLSGRGMAPSDVAAEDCDALYVGQTVDSQSRMSSHLTDARRKKPHQHCHRDGRMIDKAGKVHSSVRAVCLLDIERDCAPLIAEDHWIMKTRCLKTWESVGINGFSQRDLVTAFNGHGLILNHVHREARTSVGLPIHATKLVGTNVAPGFESREGMFDPQVAWRVTTSALLCGGIVVRPVISAQGHPHTHFKPSLFARSDGFSIGYLQMKTKWKHCFSAEGWLRLKVVVNPHYETTDPAVINMLWLEIMSSDGGGPLNIPYDPECVDDHMAWVQYVLSRVHRIYYGGAF